MSSTYIMDKISCWFVHTCWHALRSRENHLGGYYSVKKHAHKMQRKVASQINLRDLKCVAISANKPTADFVYYLRAQARRQLGNAEEKLTLNDLKCFLGGAFTQHMLKTQEDVEFASPKQKKNVFLPSRLLAQTTS